MRRGLGPLLFGTAGTGPRRYVGPFLVVLGFAGTFAAYAVGLFEITGGVVFLPADAAVVGLLAAGSIGYLRAGLVVGWLAAYAALLGAHADHALLGLSRLPVAERLRYFLRPDGLAFLGVEGVVLGTLAFAAGAVLRWGVSTLRRGERLHRAE